MTLKDGRQQSFLMMQTTPIPYHKQYLHQITLILSSSLLNANLLQENVLEYFKFFETFLSQNLIYSLNLRLYI